MDEGETVEIIDFDGDPEEIVQRKLTPKALRKLYESLDSNDPRVFNKAIEKTIEIDKRLAKKDSPVVQIANLTFPPEYIAKIGDGLKAMLGGSGGNGEKVKSLPEKGSADK